MSLSVHKAVPDAELASAPARVRTPGKHIVLFLLAVTFMLAVSTTAVRTGAVSLPRYDLPGFSAAADGKYYAPSQEFLTDLAPDATGRISFLKLSVKIVARDGAALAEIKDRKPLIEERISFFLRELSPEDFEGSEAMARVKAEMLKRARLPLTPGAAEDILVENIIIQ